jgi:hypothetical protein
MSTSYGVRSQLISANNISAIHSGHIQVVDSGNYSNGAFYITFYPTGAGCGQPTQPAIAIDLKETNPVWRKLTYQVRINGTAACWGFNAGNTQEGVDVNNGIATFNTGLGDGYFKSINCWELEPFRTGDSIIATLCNNAFNNPFHSNFDSGNFRQFYTSRRRSDFSTLAGPGLYLSCNSTGTLVTISNIFVQ